MAKSDSDEDRRGPGRPAGSLSKLSKAVVERAMASGRLPQEILLSMARGEVQWAERIDPESGEIGREPQYMELDSMRDAAKAAAPYYAPRLGAVELLRTGDDDELDSIIAELAAQAGVALGAAGEGEKDGGEGGEALEPPARKRRTFE